MKSIIIEGLLGTNFGENNYSNGMEAITFNIMMNSIDKIMNTEGLFPHPTQEPNTLEVYMLRGTQEQYDELYPQLVESYCTSQVIDENGMPSMSDADAWSDLTEKIEEEVINFVPWYNKKLK